MESIRTCTASMTTASSRAMVVLPTPGKPLSTTSGEQQIDRLRFGRRDRQRAGRILRDQYGPSVVAAGNELARPLEVNASLLCETLDRARPHQIKTVTDGLTANLLSTHGDERWNGPCCSSRLLRPC